MGLTSREKRHTNPDVLFHLALLVGMAIYISLFSYNSLTRTRHFSPVSMNYVDVARNISHGKGIVQSTLGFNQPLLFGESSSIPTPLTAEPPLYPVLIALVSLLGLLHVDAALLISAVAYGVSLILALSLVRELYDKGTAILAVSCLVFYAPLRAVSGVAGSESTSIVFMLACLWLLARSRRSSESNGGSVTSFGAGLAAGLSFSARYAMLPLILVGILFLIAERSCRRPLRFRIPLRTLSMFMLGAALPVMWVIMHNLAAIGSLMPSPLPSTSGLWTNTYATLVSVFGYYLSGTAVKSQVVVAGVAIITTAIVIVSQRRGRQLLQVFVEHGRYLLSGWSLVYLSFLICLRTITHFDNISSRFIVSAGITLVMLGAALLLRLIEPRRISDRTLHIGLALAMLVACGREVRTLVTAPIVSEEQQVVKSERLRWIAQNTTESDLIIGDNTMDIPFYLGREAAVSFSQYPYNVYLTYEDLLGYASGNCRQYQRIYLILRKRQDWSNDAWMYYFGQFITDIANGDLAKYPEITPVERLGEADVYQIVCERRPTP